LRPHRRKLPGVPSSYEIATVNRLGRERAHTYASDGPLRTGDVVRLSGRDWLVERVDDSGHVIAKPARYRLRLRHPSGREELGGFRRWRPGAPRLGHAFTTREGGRTISWEVVEEQVAQDAEGEPYLDLVSERTYAEVEELPDHELEHALARSEEELPAAAEATMARAEAAGLAVELVALEPREPPDWNEAERYIDALILEEIGDDLLEQCGVNPNRDPRETWLEKVKERLRSDLEQFRADIEGDHDEIEEWDFRDGRIFASVGSLDDESDPKSGHGWMCRLLDSGALAAAGFERVRKAQL
jgi:hypothetical protein